MPATYQRKDCAFCQYYAAKHNTERCCCAACWRRRGVHHSQSAVPPQSSRPPADVAQPAPSSVNPPTFSASARGVATASSKNLRCEHSTMPFHHCKQCVLPSYFKRESVLWDGHAVVCVPHCVLREGCGCGANCVCRRRSSQRRTGLTRAEAALPQYAAHEVPVMGPRAALYIRS
jgi:hypothetical protein